MRRHPFSTRLSRRKPTGRPQVKVRMLTDRRTQKFRGIAFVEFTSPQQLARGPSALRVWMLNCAWVR